MKKTVINRIFSGILIVILGLLFSSVVISCKKDDDKNGGGGGGGGTAQYALIIENGALKIIPGESVTYSAILIDIEGNVSQPDNVNWSTSDSNIATISGSGIVSTVAQGMVTITATVTIGGSTLTAQAPLGIYLPSAFAVAPSAIIYEVGGSIQLEAIYLSTSGVIVPTCTFESSDPAVASVSSSGLVSFNKAGSCYITVTATSLDGQPTNIVPVTVIAPFEVPLPVVRVEITPPAKDLFKDENITLIAKAFNADGQEVSGKTPVWTSANVNIAGINSNGLVTPVNPGETYVYASIDGILGQATIMVNPDTLVVVEPFFVNIPAGGTKQFTAKAYQLSRNSATEYTGINFGWEIPSYGIDIFDIATVNSTGLVTMKADAFPGMVTLVVAYDINNPHVGGAATIMAAVASDCECGSDHPEVSYITVTQQTYNLNLMGNNTAQIQATAYDAFDNPVQVQFVYCSNNIMAASVDETGMIMAAGEGEATIKVCVGSVETEITVNVTMF